MKVGVGYLRYTISNNLRQFLELGMETHLIYVLTIALKMIA